jgi:hypothetical protein
MYCSQVHQPEWLTGSCHRQKPEHPADGIDVNRQVVAAIEQHIKSNNKSLVKQVTEYAATLNLVMT